MTVSFENLSVGYARKIVISEMNARMESGRLVCLLGRNGTGKSTLLRTIAGLQPPVSGSISMDNRQQQTFTQKEYACMVGIVLTGRPDVQCMTVRELVSLGRTPYTDFFGTLSEQDKAVVDLALRQVGIEPLASRYINEISDGELQKAMIAKTIAQQTHILLLDEPTAFLDFPSKIELMKLMQDLAHEKDKTVIVSTHDLGIARKMADELWLIENKKLITNPSPEELASFVGNEALKYL